MELLQTIVKKLGIWAAPLLSIAVLVIWFLAHTTAKPGEKISVLWGMVEYTKNTESSNQLLAFAPMTNNISESHNKYGQVFDKDNIVPRKFAGAKPGVNLALVKSAYPSPPGFTSQNDDKQHYYDYPVNEGPFSHVLFYFEDVVGDPEIKKVSFVFRDQEAAVHVKNSALAALDSRMASATASGVISWDGGWYGGYTPRLDNKSYTID